ncbi:MAG TPA: response regulator, partial [Polyangiaceae bacterium]
SWSEKPIDLVLLDAVMPNVDGAQAFREIRTKCCGVPIIMVSGCPHDNVIDQLMAEGLSGFLMKPYTLAALSAAIESALVTSRDESNPPSRSQVVTDAVPQNRLSSSEVPGGG